LGLIPSTIFHSGTWAISKSLFIMIVFSITMLVAGWAIGNKRGYVPSEKQRYPRRMVQGCITGAITGFIGIGGGFIIVPSLVLFAGLSMKKAIGTSLVIITVNCIVGLLGNIETTASIDYAFLFIFSACAIAGIILGTQ